VFSSHAASVTLQPFHRVGATNDRRKTDLPTQINLTLTTPNTPTIIKNQHKQTAFLQFFPDNPTIRPSPKPRTDDPTSKPKTDDPTSSPETKNPTPKPRTDDPTPSPETKNPTPKPRTDDPTPSPERTNPTVLLTDHPSAIPRTETPTAWPHTIYLTMKPQSTFTQIPNKVPFPAPSRAPNKNKPAVVVDNVLPPTKSLSKHHPSLPKYALLPMQSTTVQNSKNPQSGGSNSTAYPQKVVAVKYPSQSPIFDARPTTFKPTFSLVPSTQPSAQPTLSLQKSPAIKKVAMVFDDCKSLGTDSIKKWVNVTSLFIISNVMTRSDAREILFLDVEIVFLKQFIPAQQGQTSGNETKEAYANTTRHQRYLTSSMSSPLALVFDLQFILRSPITNHPYDSYFTETLDTKEKRINYINLLQSSGDPVFNSINDFDVLLYGKDISQQTKLNTAMGEIQPEKIGLIAGLLVGILTAALLATSSIILGIRKRNANQQVAQKRKSMENNKDSVCTNHPKCGVNDVDEDSVYIYVPELGVDVSTLGTPLDTWKSPLEKCEDLTIGER
jgi:hypothetical protein